MMQAALPRLSIDERGLGGTAHPVVGYGGEEAVLSYNQYLVQINVGQVKTVPALAIARHYWMLPEDAILRDVVLVVRADQADHRDINHGFVRSRRCLGYGRSLYEKGGSRSARRLRSVGLTFNQIIVG